MLIEQIISEFELRGPGTPGRTCTPITAYFHEENKSLKKNLRMDYYYFTVKNIAKGNVPYFPLPGPSHLQ